MNRPCPFCGSSAAAADTLNYAGGRPGRFRIQCQDCGGATKWHEEKDGAWDAWNRRPEALLPENIFVCGDLFVHKGLVHARNPQTGFCYAGGIKGYRRMKKADWQKACAECGKAIGAQTPARTV